ncbi:MAG: PAS domain S-box protein, partial [Myxococcales bacterium]
MDQTKIIIVEDEFIVAEALRVTVEAMGYQVSSCVGSGEAALEHARTELPDLAILDIHLDGPMDGIDVGTRLRDELHIASLFISAYADDKTVKRARLTQPLGYLVKPVGERELRAAIETAVYVSKVQESLRKSEERYRTVADFTYDWETWRSPDGTFLYMSPSCERITGYPREQFLEDKDLFLRVVHPADRDRVRAHFSAMELRDCEPYEMDFRIVTRAGETRWISHSCQSIVDAGGNLGRRGSNRDITHRKAAEQERIQMVAELQAVEDKLRRSEGKLEEAGRLARIGYWEYLPMEHTTEWSSVLHEILGQKRRISWETFLSRLPPDDRARFDRAFHAAETKGNLETRYMHPEGDLRYLVTRYHLERDPDGALVRAFGATQDITDTKRAEATNARFGRIMDGSFNEVYLLDSMSFCCLQANRGARLNTGYSLAELRERTLLDLSPDLPLQEWQDALRTLRSGASEIVSCATRLRRKNGSSYDAEIRTQLLLTETPPVLLAIIQDVTERRRAQEILEHQAGYDALTDLPNRRLFTDLLQRAISQARREQSILPVLFLDLDGFKAVNDRWG